MSVGVDKCWRVKVVKKGEVWVEIPPPCPQCKRDLLAGLMVVGWNGQARTYSCLKCGHSWVDAP